MARLLLRVLGGMAAGLLGLVALAVVLVFVATDTVLLRADATPAEREFAHRFGLARPALLTSTEPPSPATLEPWLREALHASWHPSPAVQQRGYVARMRLDAVGAGVALSPLVALLEDAHADVARARQSATTVADPNRRALIERLLAAGCIRAQLEAPPPEVSAWLDAVATGAALDASAHERPVLELLATAEVQVMLGDATVADSLREYGEARRFRRFVAATALQHAQRHAGTLPVTDDAAYLKTLMERGYVEAHEIAAALELVADHDATSLSEALQHAGVLRSSQDASVREALFTLQPHDDEDRAAATLTRWQRYLDAHGNQFATASQQHPRFVRSLSQTRLGYTLASLLPAPPQRWLPALGQSRDDEAVWSQVAAHAVSSLLFAACALLLSVTLALFIAMRLALHAVTTRRHLGGGSWLMAAAYVLAALPAVVLAAWAVLVVGMPDAAALEAREAAWARATTGERIVQGLALYALPTLLLAISACGLLLGRALNRMQLTLAQPHATAARARGVDEGDLALHHGLQPALAPWLRSLSEELPRLVGALLIIEWVFGLPGLGHLAVNAALDADLALLLGALFAVGFTLLLARALLTLAAAASDPRSMIARPVSRDAATSERAFA